MPGKHDQSTHGHGKGGVRQSLAQAGTTEQVAATATAEAKTITGRDIPFDMAGSDVQVAREHAEGVLQGLERFPGARLVAVTTYGPGSQPSGVKKELEDRLGGAGAVTRGHVTMDQGAIHQVNIIYFNNAFAAHPAYYQQHLDIPKHEGSVPSSPKGVALHEFGHVVASHNAYSDRQAYDRAVDHAEAAGREPRSYIVQHISAYASTSMGEFAAESFADVMLNGDNAHELSKSAFSLLDANYRGSL